MSTRIVLDLLARFTTDRARPVHSRASNRRWLIIVRVSATSACVSMPGPAPGSPSHSENGPARSDPVEVLDSRLTDYGKTDLQLC
jgi:hypothetical protein